MRHWTPKKLFIMWNGTGCDIFRQSCTTDRMLRLWVCARGKKKKMLMCLCTSCQQFCLIEMDGWTVPGPCCPLKKLSSRPSVLHTVLHWPETNWLALLHALQLTDGSGTQEWLLDRRLGWRGSHQYSYSCSLRSLSLTLTITWNLKWLESLWNTMYLQNLQRIQNLVLCSLLSPMIL